MAVAKHIPGNTHKGMCFKDLPSLLNLVSILLRVRLQLRYLPRLTQWVYSRTRPWKHWTLAQHATIHEHPFPFPRPRSSSQWAPVTKIWITARVLQRFGMMHTWHRLPQSCGQTLYIAYIRFTCIQSNLDICMQIQGKLFVVSFEYHVTFVCSNTSLSDSRLNSWLD